MRMRPGGIFCNTVALISLLFIFAGCAQRKLNVKEDNLAGSNAPARLQAVKVSGGASQVEISADKNLVYAFYKLTAPPKAVIDLAQTEPGAVTTPVEVNAGNIKRIEVTRHGFGESVLSRIEISLAKDEEFSVNTDPVDKGKLLVTFAKPPVEDKEVKVEGKIEETQLKVEDVTSPPVAGAAVKSEEKQPGDPESLSSPAAVIAENKQVKADAKEEAKASPAQKGKVLTSVNAVKDGVELNVTGGVDAFNSFKLTKPFRLVVDLPGVKSGMNEKTISLNNFGINKARLGISPDKVRIVFDALQETLPPYRVIKSENGLKVLFNGVSPAASAAPLKTAVQVPKEPVKQTAPEVVNEPAKQKPLEAARENINPEVEKNKPIKSNISSVETIDFKSVGEFSQISIKVTGDCKAEQPKKVAGGWALTIKNCQLPRKLQRMLDTRAFPSAVQEITPYQVKTREGYDAKILVKLRGEAPFNFKQEGAVISWDVRNPEIRKIPAPLPEPVKVPPVPSPAVVQETKGMPRIEKELVAEQHPATTQLPDKNKTFTGRKVTLEFSDADVRKIFQLIAEVSNLNFLIADDVSGTISLKLVNVPWDQALDVILESKNLDMRREGNIVQIKPRGKFRTQEQEEAEAKLAREKRMELKTKVFDVNFAAVTDVASQFDKLKSDRGSISQDARTNRVIVTDIEDRLARMGNLLKELDIPEKQVMIEARIVEATSDFTRDLGVQWGLHYKDGSASFLGINQLDTGFGGVVTPPPSSGSSGPGGAIGMSFGKLTSNIQLDLRLSAAATANLVKIISTPKVVTLNNKAAKISQGKMQPYLSTSAEGTKTEFVEAALTLEVTPHITADGSIGMKIKASNNSVGAPPTPESPPPINKKEATTELLVMNGETTVIGGIYVDGDTESNAGVPFLMDIPLLGWLFKSNSKAKTKTELLIFITPRIVS